MAEVVASDAPPKNELSFEWEFETLPFGALPAGYTEIKLLAYPEL